jgi:hypothetical protein
MKERLTDGLGYLDNQVVSCKDLIVLDILFEPKANSMKYLGKERHVGFHTLKPRDNLYV